MKFLWLFTIFLVSINQSLSQNQSEEQLSIDSLFEITNNQTLHDTIRAAAFLNASTLLYEKNIDTLYSLNLKAIAISKNNLNKHLNKNEEIAFTKILSESYANVGFYHQSTGDFNSAIKQYIIAYKLDKKIMNLKGLSSIFNNLGMIFYAKGDIPKALKYFLLSLKIDEHIGNEEELIEPLNNIAYVYEHQEDYINALKYYKKGLLISQRYKDKPSEGSILINIGSVLKKQNKTDEAVSLFKQSLTIFNQLKNKYGKASSLLNLGVIYLSKNEIDSSQNYLEKSLDIYEKNNNPEGVSIAHVNLGRIELLKGNLSNAEKHGEKAFELANQNSNIYNIQKASELLGDVYEKQNKGLQALEMHKLFINMRDSLNNIKTQKAIITKNMQYDFDKKEALASVEHEKELAIKEAEKKKQNIIIWAGAIVLILIIGFSAFIANRLKLSNKQKIIIEQKNKENELLLGEIHHRVKNNLQVISSLLSLQERSIDDVATKSAIAEGKERVKSMGLIHKMLYQNDNYSGVEMDNYGRELIKGLIDSFGIKATDIDVNLNFSRLKLDVDTAIPVGLIINELVINTLKYAFEKTNSPTINVSLIKQAENLILEVSDNGTGKVSDLENSKSFGMKLINSLAKQLGGKLVISDESGLHFKISISHYKLV